MTITPARLRSWMRRYGHAGVLAVAAYLTVHSRRAVILTATGSASLVFLALLAARHTDPSSALHAQHPGSQRVRPDAPASRPVTITIAASKATDTTDLLMTARDGNRVLWTDTCSHYNAIEFPNAGVIVYSHDYTFGLVARRFDGRVLWRGGEYLPAGRQILCGGQHVVLMEHYGPNWGVMIAQPETWEGHEGVVGRETIVASDALTGSEIWSRSEAGVGQPLWTNGDVFLTERTDVSHQAVQHLKRVLRPYRDSEGMIEAKHAAGSRLAALHATLPVYLETRSMKTLQPIWTRPIAGLLPPLAGVREIAPGHVEFTFKTAGKPESDGCDFVTQAGDTTVVVPIEHPQLDEAGQTVRVVPAGR